MFTCIYIYTYIYIETYPHVNIAPESSAFADHVPRKLMDVHILIALGESIQPAGDVARAQAELDQLMQVSCSGWWCLWQLIYGFPRNALYMVNFHAFPTFESTGG